MADSPELTQEQVDEFLATVRLPLVTDATRRAVAWSTAATGILLGALAGGTAALRDTEWSGLWWVALQTFYLGGLIALVLWRRRTSRGLGSLPSVRRTAIVGAGLSAVATIVIVGWIQFGGTTSVVGLGLLAAAPALVAAHRIAPEAFHPRIFGR